MAGISETIFIGYDKNPGEVTCMSVIKRTDNPKKLYLYLNAFYGVEAEALYNRLIGGKGQIKEENHE
jgi:hypothetical protein